MRPWRCWISDENCSAFYPCYNNVAEGDDTLVGEIVDQMICGRLKSPHKTIEYSKWIEKKNG